MFSLFILSCLLIAVTKSLQCDQTYWWLTLENCDYCGAVEYNYTYSYEISGITYSYDAQYSYHGCANSSQCTELAGSTNGCTKVAYDYYTWVPTGLCDANGEAQGVTQKYTYETYYACCQTATCNTNYNYDTCTSNLDLTNYVTDLSNCWYDYYQVFVDEMYCQHKAAYDWSLECSAEGQWNATTADVSAECYYQLTCSDDLIEILKGLATCGCSAAYSYGYDSASLETYLSDYYSAYCNNVVVECEGENAFVVVTYWYIKWSFELNIAYSSVDDTLKADIKAIIATNAKVDESTITITASSTSSNNRRLLQSASTTTFEVSIKTQDELSAKTVQNNVDENQPSSYDSYTASNGPTSTSSESETLNAGTITTTTGGPTSDNHMLSVGVVAMIVIAMLLFN
jgi:hypothetical protein